MIRSPEGGYSTVQSESRPGDSAPELQPVALDTSVILPALVGSPSYEPVDRSALGARASSGDGIDGDGTPPDGNGAARRGVFRIPRNYR